jgi:hypothetical protein
MRALAISRPFFCKYSSMAGRSAVPNARAACSAPCATCACMAAPSLEESTRRTAEEGGGSIEGQQVGRSHLDYPAAGRSLSRGVAVHLPSFGAAWQQRRKGETAGDVAPRFPFMGPAQ